MNILIIGDEGSARECKQKFGDGHTYLWEKDHQEAKKFVVGQDVIFDFILDEEPEQVEVYFTHPVTVFINTCKLTLGDLLYAHKHEIRSLFFGFNGMPTFLNRLVLEVSVLNPQGESKLASVCKALQTEFLLVDDRVGLVTPRVVCMIINEAYYTVQEGTATREDIDLAMKLGMNYPFGPFEWCARIGIKHVYELLLAVYDDTKDERYKICALLKKEYLRA